MAAGTGTEQVEAAASQALARTPLTDQATLAPSTSDSSGMCQWVRRKAQDGSTSHDIVELVHQHAVTQVTWHGRGDYFASVAPTGNTQVCNPF